MNKCEPTFAHLCIGGVIYGISTLLHRSICISFLFKDFIYLLLERGEGTEKERERNINVWLPFTCPLLGTWPTTQACALTGN